MNRTKILFVPVFALLCTIVNAQQDRYTAKSIFTAYRGAIVKVVHSGDDKYGTGFIISEHLVVTANHVVNPPGSLTYLPGIQVVLANGTAVRAEPVLGQPTEKSRQHDYAILSTKESLKAKPLRLGSWTEVSEGDQMTTMGYALDPPTPLL